MIGVKDEDTIQRASKNRIDLIRLARHPEHHVEEVRRVVELVARIHERLADRIFEGSRRNRGHFRDHAKGGEIPLHRVADIDGVMIKSGERADGAHHHGHRMRVTAEAGEEPVHLLVDHGVIGDAIDEVRVLLLVRQLSVEQKVACSRKLPCSASSSIG